jgi:hypothetical protein
VPAADDIRVLIVDDDARFPNVKLPGTRRVLIPLRDIDAYLAGATLETKRLAAGGRLVQPARGRGRGGGGA